MISALPPGFTIDQMTRPELALLEQWAADEGWNPGIHDLDIAWSCDPDAFIALRHRGSLVGGGSIFSHAGAEGFMGLFIVHKDYRGNGLGTVLWHERLRRLRERLAPGATIGMDGVFAMVPFYEKGGFRRLHRDLRFQGIAAGRSVPGTVPISDVPWEELAAFDRKHAGSARSRLLQAWLNQPGGIGLALRDQASLVAYGFIRPCRAGYKIGPVIAETPRFARQILAALQSSVEGMQVQIDIPEPNAEAVCLAESFGWSLSFGCIRMAFGPPVPLSVQTVYAVMSLEFG